MGCVLFVWFVIFVVVNGLGYLVLWCLGLCVYWFVLRECWCEFWFGWFVAL